MASRNWLVDGRTIAKKVKNPTWSSASQSPSRDSGANRECPNCHHSIANNHDWPGLPAGVKFDPSKAELLEHLAAKCGVGDAKPHELIDEFIPTLKEEKGICYTHPKNLPGVKKDGSSMHFFHRTVNAYSTGQRKRRKIQNGQNLITENVRWHKTGKTKPIIENGVHKGWKKIMVLYKSSEKGCKPHKSNWVMHQYHLGTEEDEKGGEFVVSKISYQPEKHSDVNGGTSAVEDLSTSPKTPKPNAPPLVVAKASPIDDVDDSVIPVGDDHECNDWLVGESQAYEDQVQGLEDPLLCKEILDPHPHPINPGLDQIVCSTSTRKDDESTGAYNAPCGISDLANLEFDSPPDFLQNDSPLGSQESVLDWLAGLI
ncbi:NAC domain-containing protein 73-like isoform X1 [Punica granatum]|uniref:NAC domain-containing protein 73-like isoform X1 n=1 Tax=Punica granatum TaxID=22663 RepID=A0A6P8C9F2_PUNGR|nr:NAC domain-containing protein 73-like isoform X1 [Punica granatum]